MNNSQTAIGRFMVKGVFVISVLLTTFACKNMEHMKTTILAVCFCLFSGMAMSACSAHTHKVNGKEDKETVLHIPATLKDSLQAIADASHAEVGIALLTDGGDTLLVNNEDKYPLMSVFKLHQAIALAHELESKGVSLDTLVHISAGELNPDTWSPMMKERGASGFDITVRELLRYTLTLSDNNASNYMFRHLLDVGKTDAYIARLVPRNSFRLSFTEEEMWGDHKKCYANHSSPLGVAMLLNRLYENSIMGKENQEFICRTLRECNTGKDRIVAPLMSEKGLTVGHKTGSGFRDGGMLSAQNDAAYITRPDGRHYTLVVLVKDFKGTEDRASAIIARISAVVYSALTEQSVD